MIAKTNRQLLKMQLTRLASRRKGILGSMMLIALILIISSVMALGVDYSHLVASRAQLRNAADAAALGGAMQLFTNPSSCEQYAKLIANENLADGVRLNDENSRVDVSAVAVPPVGTNLGTVTVTIKLTLNHLLSPLFGRYLDNVKVVSVAGWAGQVTQPYEDVMFPLAVSLDRRPGADIKPGNNNNVGSGRSLLDAIKGDKIFTIYINSQKYKNGAFTSFTEKNTNANWLNDAIAKCLDIQTSKNDDVTIPSVKVTVDNIYLANGVMGQKALASDPQYSALTDGRTLILPVIDGDPAYNQSRLCIGMVAVQVLSVTKNEGNGVVEKLVVKIVDTAIPGVCGTLNSTGNPEWDWAIKQTLPKTVKLLR